MAMEKKKAEKRYEVCVGRWQRVGSATLNIVAQGRHRRERGTLGKHPNEAKEPACWENSWKDFTGRGKNGYKGFGAQVHLAPKMLEVY